MGLSVSVVTPSLNQGRFLERSLESVLSQDIEGLEYFVIDGGSNDESLGILERYTDSVDWTSEPDSGQADAVNKGLARATGDIIGWLNSDDIYYPGAIKFVLQQFEAFPEVDVIYGLANHIDINGSVIEPYPTEDWNLRRLKEVCYISQPAAFFRRRVVATYGFLNAQLEYCMDYEYWLRIALNGGCFRYGKSLLAGSRMYPENKTLGSRVEAHREINNMLIHTLGRVPDRWIFNFAHARLDSLLSANRGLALHGLLLPFLSITAALYWNKRISPAMLNSAYRWIRGARAR